MITYHFISLLVIIQLYGAAADILTSNTVLQGVNDHSWGTVAAAIVSASAGDVLVGYSTFHLDLAS